MDVRFCGAYKLYEYCVFSFRWQQRMYRCH